MVDRREKRSDSDEISSKTPDGTLIQAPKTCGDCGTTKTPLWRGGPAGPKSLCNACGIRNRKRRKALLGLSNKGEKKARKKSNSNVSTVTSDGSSSNTSEESSKKRSGGPAAVLQRPRSSMPQPWRMLGEEEQAALLLMAMSCGSFFA